MVLVYQSLLGAKGQIELDLNFMYRSPLWQPVWMSSIDWINSVTVRVLDVHEIAAGKLSALLNREASRDLFDAYQMLCCWDLDPVKIRLAFVVYAGMMRENWRDLSSELVRFSVSDIRNKLVPVMHRDLIPGTRYQDIERWANHLMDGCRAGLAAVLPFHENEKEFLSLLEEGEIKPELLSNDDDFCAVVEDHPALLWRIKAGR